MWLKNIKGDKTSYLYWGYLIIIGILFYFLNLYTPYSDDDFHYCYLFGTDTHIRTIDDIIKSQYIHYFEMNGRFTTHFFVQLFDGILGKNLFNICNSICFILFLHLLTITITNEKKDYYIVLTIITTCIFFIIPDFRYPFLWMSGSCNYLWTSVILLVYNKLFNYDIPRILIPILFVYSILCGWTHEGFIIGLLCGYTLYFIINKDKFNTSQKYQLVGLYCGALLLILSPGSFKRFLNTTNDNSSIIQHCFMLFKSIIDLNNIRILPILFLTLFFLHKKKRLYFKHFIKNNITFICAIVILVPFIIFTKNTSYTSRFGFELFSLILLTQLVITNYNKFTTPILISANLISIILIMGAIYYCKVNYNDYISQISQIQNNCKTIITNSSRNPSLFEKFILRHRHTDYSGDYYFIENIYFKRHVIGNKKISFVPQKVIDKIETEEDTFDNFCYISNDTPFYIKRIHNNVNKVTFILKKQEIDSIPLYIRPIAHRLSRYTIKQLDTPYYNTFKYKNNHYIMVAKNEAIDNRLEKIIIE